jgi:hypothetical protein
MIYPGLFSQLYAKAFLMLEAQKRAAAVSGGIRMLQKLNRREESAIWDAQR